MKRKIYICGNPIVSEDSMPFRILPQLRSALPEIDFADFDPTENFPQEDPLYIIDTILNSGKVMTVEDISGFEDAPHFSVHDADLAFHLKWLKKLGKLPRVVIFGVPAQGDEAAIVKSLAEKLRK